MTAWAPLSPWRRRGRAPIRRRASSSAPRGSVRASSGASGCTIMVTKPSGGQISGSRGAKRRQNAASDWEKPSALNSTNARPAGPSYPKSGWAPWALPGSRMASVAPNMSATTGAATISAQVGQTSGSSRSFLTRLASLAPRWRSRSMLSARSHEPTSASRSAAFPRAEVRCGIPNPLTSTCARTKSFACRPVSSDAHRSWGSSSSRSGRKPVHPFQTWKGRDPRPRPEDGVSVCASRRA